MYQPAFYLTTNKMMTEQELDYLADRVVETFFKRFSDPPKHWVSQNQAYNQYGGRAFVEKLRKEGKVATRRTANRREYYVKDLTKHLTPRSVILQTRKYTKKQ